MIQQNGPVYLMDPMDPLHRLHAPLSDPMDLMLHTYDYLFYFIAWLQVHFSKLFHFSELITILRHELRWTCIEAFKSSGIPNFLHFQFFELPTFTYSASIIVDFTWNYFIHNRYSNLPLMHSSSSIKDS